MTFDEQYYRDPAFRARVERAAARGAASPKANLRSDNAGLQKIIAAREAIRLFLDTPVDAIEEMAKARPAGW